MNHPSFHSKQGLDSSFKLPFLHSPDDVFLYLPPNFSYLIKKPYDNLIDEEVENNLSLCKVNTSKTFEKFQKNKNSINSYEVVLKEVNGEKKIRCRIYEKVVYNFIDKTKIKIIGIQGVITIAQKETDALIDNFYTFLLQKSQLALVCSSIKQEFNETNNLVAKITEIFENHLQFRNQNGDEWFSKGKSYFMKQLQFFIQRDLTIEFILPAFPFKSKNNLLKVLSHLPDKGEKLALETLSVFCKEIEKNYKKGAAISIVSDGRVFADIFGISDQHITEYGESLREIAKKANQYENIHFYDLQDFLDKCETHDIARERLITYFGRRIEEITERIAKDPDYAKMYCGFTKFLMEDLKNFINSEGKVTYKPDKQLNSNDSNENSNDKTILNDNTSPLTNTQLKKAAKEKAKYVMMRNDAYSRMVENLFPLHIRLSIHAHSNCGPKFAIRLLNVEKISNNLVADKNLHIPTPWHNVVVGDGEGGWLLMKRAEAEKKGGELVEEDGRASYYLLKNYNKK